jgi:branched-chain amino acid transport system permease protein
MTAVDLPSFVIFITNLVILALIYSLLAIGLNIHFGYTGLLNFGHVAFFAAGAYTAAILTIPPPGSFQGTVNYTIGLGLPMPAAFPISLAAGAIAGGILALLIGLTSIRLDHHYLAVATFALAGIFENFIRNEEWLTRGVFGLNEVPRPGAAMLGTDLWQVVYLVFTLVLTIGVYVFTNRMMNAPFGRLLKGIREDEDAAQMLGKDTNLVKLKSFVIGGMIAGLAGAVFAHWVGSVVAGQFVDEVTFMIWMAMLLGGAGSNRGVILGSFLFIAFRETTRFLPQIADDPSTIPSLRLAIVGLLLLLVIHYRPQGLMGNLDEIVVSESGGDDQ